MEQQSQPQPNLPYSWPLTGGALLLGAFFLGPMPILSMMAISLAGVVLAKTLTQHLWEGNLGKNILSLGFVALAALGLLLSSPLVLTMGSVFLAGIFFEQLKDKRASFLSDINLDDIPDEKMRAFYRNLRVRASQAFQCLSDNLVVGAMTGGLFYIIGAAALLPLSAAPISGTILAMIFLHALAQDREMHLSLVLTDPESMKKRFNITFVEIKSRTVAMFSKPQSQAPSSSSISSASFPKQGAGGGNDKS